MSLAETQKRLLTYLRAGRVHSSLLLTGPDRAGKLAVAKTMAKTMLCRTPRSTGFCSECSPCKRVEKEVHPDVFFFREEEEGVIKIEPLRQLCLQMEPAALEGGAKIAIVDEAHRMSASAANAFLKTLEEPGPDRYFWLLTTQPGAMLPTILSRCLQFAFKPTTDTTPAREQQFRKLFESGIDLVGELKEKEDCVAFVRFLQTELRAAAFSPHAGTPSLPAVAKLGATAAASKFDEALALEGRLRSNASFPLLLEVFLRKEFFP